MQAKQLSLHYRYLTAEERFRLVLSASGRGDEVERERLVRAGSHIHVSRQDHAPYAHAFNEVGLLIYLEVLEDASRYFDALAQASRIFNEINEQTAQPSVAGETDDGVVPKLDEKREMSKDENGTSAKDEKAKAKHDSCKKPSTADRRVWQRYLGLVQAAGYVLLAKVDGWKLFCEMMNVPAFISWQGLPGFERLEHSLDHAKDLAFNQDEFLRWLNTIRPQGTPEMTAVSLTASAMADAMEEVFQQRTRWWGG